MKQPGARDVSRGGGGSLRGRNRSVRLAALASCVFLLVLGTSASAWGADAKGAHRLIFDIDATPSWTHEFHGVGSSTDGAEDVVLTKNGVAYVAGVVGTAAATDLSLMKLVDGVPVWPAPKTYDSPYHSVDVATDVALGPGNTVYTAGMSIGANMMYDIIVVKWSSSGIVKWARRYDGPAHGHDQATSMVVDADGNVTVSGGSVNAGNTDWVMVSWSSSGARRWVARMQAAGVHEVAPTSLALAGDGSVYATGLLASSPDVKAITVKYSPAGRKLWQKTYAGPSGGGAITFASAARPGGGVFVGGMTLSPGTGSDGIVMSYTASGARDVFALDIGPGGASEQRFNDLTVTSTGQVVAVGSTTTGVNDDCRAVAYTTAGTIAAQATLPGAWRDAFEAVAADSFGGFYATGSYHTAVNKTAIVTVRGSVLTGGGGWTSLWAPAFISEENEPNAIAVSGSTAYVVGKCSEGPAFGTDQVVLGYVY